ncbi:hypothetical protein QVD17_15369 [Tagetes erecta]|uniref:Secreted protein n=1 Tax=Tagetes erecta TaxID=13708 RepID=A0AAD8NZK9_TARER|nr:hypothetical protein QVD17_15369 [Tagetes erecta]
MRFLMVFCFLNCFFFGDSIPTQKCLFRGTFHLGSVSFNNVILSFTSSHKWHIAKQYGCSDLQTHVRLSSKDR